jgi:hypothetical protein
MAGRNNLATDYRPVEEPTPSVRNTRIHSLALVPLIAGSIRKYDFSNPVLLDGENGILARGLAAFRNLGR